MKNVSFTLTQGASAYTWSSSFNIDPSSTSGQVCGQVARRINQRLAMTKASGNGKGLSLRNDFNLFISFDGVPVLDTQNIDADLKRILRGGLTDRSQGRFGQAIAFCIFAEHMDKVTEYAATLGNGDTYTIDELFSSVRFALDCKMTELI